MLSGHTFAAETAMGQAQEDLNIRVRGQVTGTRTRMVGTERWLTAVTYYDSKYRPIQTIADNHLDGLDRTSTVYDFVGKPLKTRLQHRANGVTRTVANEMKYDHMGRLKEQWQRMDNEAEVLLARHSYNELGQLVDKELHSRDNGGSFLQSVDTRYNIRGWLTSINNTTLSNDGVRNDDTGDLFGLELGYEAGMRLGGTAQFNGNIAEMLWATTTDGGKQRGYAYTYDKLNRLKTAKYRALNGTEVDWYTVQGLNYDLNGNILRLQRRGLRTGQAYTNTGRTYGMVDNLTYAYEGNRLATVNDGESTVVGPAGDFRDNGVKKTYAAGNATTWEYGYDANGNMTRDDNKGIVSVSYNHLNLPQKVDFGPAKGYITFDYTATGQKIRKTVQEPGKAAVVTNYSGLFVYSPEALFAHTPEGRALYEPLADNKWRYEYHLKDHLGNLRVSFAEPQNFSGFATMETMRAMVEEESFENVGETRHQDRVHARTGSHAALLGVGRGKPLGPLKRVSLHKGDSLKAEVFGLYEQEAKKGVAFSLASWLASSAAGVTIGGEGGNKAKALPLLGAGVALVPQAVQKAKGAPLAYIRYIVYDADSNYVESGYQPLAREAQGEWQQLELMYVAAQNGYAEVYVANESAEDVWMDDMRIMVASPMLVQENHYDPWGQNLVGIEQQGSPDHLFQYNGKEKQTELGLNWLDYGARMYDAQIGRWHVVDPMAEQRSWLSPYNYVQNNPILRIDPNGMLDDIVINGENNSSVTVKTDLVDISLQSNIDFNGNHVVTDLSNVAIGYQSTLSTTATAAVGTNYDAYMISTMFLGGDYAGYWYDYAGVEGQLQATTSVEASIGAGRSWFVAFNNNPETNNPDGFAGNYFGGGASASFQPIIGGATIGGQYSVSQDGTWRQFSVGLSVSVGPQIGFLGGGSVTAEAHMGSLKLLTKPVPTNQRSIIDRASNFLSH
ncbi:RHS repeat-associated core domain-containing protein [Pontibacter sp. 13R65]|uniref:RHS repeat-associated core domain-containing protein n=1 Tax=Pontibacter sp. 13R65 TaxID=3127458 RepID=UPI00301D3D68